MMAQSEEIKRLLWKEEIVGWEKKELINGRVRTLYRSSKKGAIYFWVESPITKFDSFEPGIKVGDEWWFSGDRGQHNSFGGGKGFVLKYNNIEIQWKVVYDDRTFGVWNLSSYPSYLCDAKHIGTIHDKETRKDVT